MQVLLRYQNAVSLDPLELHEGARGGIPGLFGAVRDGTVRVCKRTPAPALPRRRVWRGLLPVLCQRMLGEDLRLASVESRWLGDPEAAVMVAAEPGAWMIRPAWSRLGAIDAQRRADQPWAYAAQRRVEPSFVPCLGPGEVLEPRGVTLRLFLLFDGTTWRALPGGLARVADEPGAGRRGSADARARRRPRRRAAHIEGRMGARGGRQRHRRTWQSCRARPADPPHIGRHARAGWPTISTGSAATSNAWRIPARLTRTLLGRLSRAGLLPRDVPELAALSACLVDARMISEDVAAGAARPPC